MGLFVCLLERLLPEREDVLLLPLFPPPLLAVLLRELLPDRELPPLFAPDVVFFCVVAMIVPLLYLDMFLEHPVKFFLIIQETIANRDNIII